MNRLQLHALLREAKALSGHSEFVIVGSLVILGAVPVAKMRLAGYRKRLKL